MNVATRSALRPSGPRALRVSSPRIDWKRSTPPFCSSFFPIPPIPPILVREARARHRSARERDDDRVVPALGALAAPRVEELARAPRAARIGGDRARVETGRGDEAARDQA